MIRGVFFMPTKVKFAAEEKERVVLDYLNGKVGYRETLKKYQINAGSLKNWLRIYKACGINGLMPQSSCNSYSKETKLCAISDYLSGNFTVGEICEKYGLRSPTQLKRWEKKYNGHEDLKSSHSGGNVIMTKGRKTTFQERIEIVSYCIEQGTDYVKVIEKYHVSYQQIYSWVRKYHEKGIDGLTDKRGKNKDEASMTNIEKLKLENRLLHAKLKDKEMENDLLKKVMEIERRRG